MTLSASLSYSLPLAVFLRSMLLVCGIAARGLTAAEPDFAGEWDTTYGRMSLRVEGKSVVGTYFVPGGPVNDLRGESSSGKLTFTYSEPDVIGEGQFILSTDRRSFSGRWREKGQSRWDSWDGRRVVAAAAGFSGVWKTSFGLMRLNQDGEKVTGCYTFGERSEISGTVKSGVLGFTYQEPSGVAGVGEFKLGADAGSFSGTWKQQDGKLGGGWEGARLAPTPGRSWLVVLEANWEANLRANEYSFGDMLKQFFTRVPGVAVRHRYFDGRENFARWCAELPYLNEPIVFYIASHGTEAGITVGRNTLTGAFIGQQLRHARDIRLVHLGACLAMAGDVPQRIRAASGLPAPVSGYTKVADWAGSAVIDFMLLDLVLARQMQPAEAVRQVQKSMAFAGDKELPDSAIKPAGLKVLE